MSSGLVNKSTCQEDGGGQFLSDRSSCTWDPSRTPLCTSVSACSVSFTTPFIISCEFSVNMSLSCMSYSGTLIEAGEGSREPPIYGSREKHRWQPGLGFGARSWGSLVGRALPLWGLMLPPEGWCQNRVEL